MTADRHYSWIPDPLTPAERERFAEYLKDIERATEAEDAVALLEAVRAFQKVLRKYREEQSDDHDS